MIHHAIPPATGKRIRVLLVDDHKILREGLRMLMEEYPSFDVVGEAGDGIEAVELARTLEPDAIVMDFTMPVMDGGQATAKIKAEHPHIVVVALTMGDDYVGQIMLRAGANAYINKGAEISDLCRVIGRFFEGDAVCGKEGLIS